MTLPVMEEFQEDTIVENLEDNSNRSYIESIGDFMTVLGFSNSS
jgi:hypothetical protein